MGQRTKLTTLLIMIFILLVFTCGCFGVLDFIEPEQNFTFKTVDDQSHPKFVKDGLEDGAVFIFFTQNDENCPPCARMRPKVEELIDDFEDDVVFYIININEDEITMVYKGEENTETMSDSEINEAYHVYDLKNTAAGRTATPTFVIITLDENDGKVKPSFAVGYGEFKEEDAEETKDALANDLVYAIFKYNDNK